MLWRTNRWNNISLNVNVNQGYPNHKIFFDDALWIWLPFVTRPVSLGAADSIPVRLCTLTLVSAFFSQNPALLGEVLFYLVIVLTFASIWTEPNKHIKHLLVIIRKTTIFIHVPLLISDSLSHLNSFSCTVALELLLLMDPRNRNHTIYFLLFAVLGVSNYMNWRRMVLCRKLLKLSSGNYEYYICLCISMVSGAILAHDCLLEYMQIMQHNLGCQRRSVMELNIMHRDDQSQEAWFLN